MFTRKPAKNPKFCSRNLEHRGIHGYPLFVGKQVASDVASVVLFRGLSKGVARHGPAWYSSGCDSWSSSEASLADHQVSNSWWVASTSAHNPMVNIPNNRSVELCSLTNFWLLGIDSSRPHISCFLLHSNLYYQRSLTVTNHYQAVWTMTHQYPPVWFSTTVNYDESKIEISHSCVMGGWSIPWRILLHLWGSAPRLVGGPDLAVPWPCDPIW